MNQSPIKAIHRLRFRVDFHPDPAAGLIHQIDGFIGEIAICNVAVRQSGRSNDRRVRNRDAMMNFVLFFKASKNRNGILDTWLIDQHLLETPLKSRILFDVLTVFVKCRGTNTMELSSRQSRLQHIASIHRAIGLTRTDHGMELIDKKNDLPFKLGHLGQQCFHALFKFTTKLGACNQGRHIKRQQPLPFDPFRDFSVDNPKRKTLHNGGLANTRLANEHRVIFGSALKHLNGPSNFIIPANDRIQLALFGSLSKVNRVFLERSTLLFDVGIIHFLASTHFFNREGQCIAF